MKKVLTLFALLLIAKFAIAGPCTPSATGTLTSAATSTNPLRVQFVSTTPGTTTPFFWYASVDWGDGNSGFVGSAVSLLHDYTSPGTYNVKYIYTKHDSLNTSWSCTDTVKKSITVNYSPCAATFTATSSSTGLMTFTATNLSGTTTGITYNWNFGDGSTGTGMTVTHTYANNSPKTVTLTTTGTSCSTTTSKIVYPYTPCITDSANFYFHQNGLQTTFMDNSTWSSQRTFNWNFGDGNTSTQENPVHIYATSGVYNVRLIVNWDTTCVDTTYRMVSITNSGDFRGFVHRDSTTLPDTAMYKVWLITFDSATNILAAVDSQTIVEYPGSGIAYYEFPGTLAGQYRVKAAMLNNAPGTTGYVPTYHTNSLFWNTATIVNYYGGSNLYYDIFMQTGTLTTGPGFVGGDVTLGANKGTSAGVAGLNMYLLDINDQLVKSAITDANGTYSFGQVPAGIYRIYPELMGYTTTATSYFTISNTQTKVEGMNFKVSNNKKTITPAPVSIKSISNEVTYGIYPNPAKDKATIRWNAATTGDAHVMITDIAGKTVYSTVARTDKELVMDLSSLNKGLYLITVSANNIGQTSKLVIE